MLIDFFMFKIILKFCDFDCIFFTIVFLLFDILIKRIKNIFREESLQ